MNKENVEIMFKMFDTDGDGKISTDELKSLFKTKEDGDTKNM